MPTLMQERCPVCHGRGTVRVEKRGKIETRADCGECDGSGVKEPVQLVET